MPDVGVDGVGKINRRGAARQRDDFAFGRNNIDFVGEQIHFNVFQKFHRVSTARLQVQNILQPLVGAQRGFVFLAELVCPMACHAHFGDGVHFARADLHFNRQAVWAVERGVQRFVAVGFGDGDVVFDFTRARLIQAVQRAQGGIAGGDTVHNHAKAVDVQHFFKFEFFGQHFLMNVVEIFLAPANLRFNIAGNKAQVDVAQHAVYHVVAIFFERGHGAFENFVAFGVHGVKRQVLQFTVNVVEPQAVGDGGIDF